MRKLIVNCSLLTVIVFLLTTSYPLLATTYAQNLPTKDEQAIYNINQGTLPNQIVEEKVEDESIITQALAKIGSFIANFRARFYIQSERLINTDVPTQILPDKKDDLFANLKGFLSGSTGVYGTELPEFPKPPADIQGYEKAYEQSNFPEGIAPITGQ